MMTPALLSAALLLLLLPGAPATSPLMTPFTLKVTNSVTGAPTRTYTAYVDNGGILLGGMRSLQASDVGFSYTYSQDSTYGPVLQSVNGVFKHWADRTFWQLLVKDGTVVADVGIGCYLPSANEIIVLNFYKY